MIGTILLGACGGSVSGSSDPASGGDDTGTLGSDGGTPTADTGTTPETAPADDAAPPPSDDHGAPSDKYPAFPVDTAELQNNGGDVLTAPVIVTITFPDDPNAAKYEDFGDKIGASDYWKQITSEYGIGPAVSGDANHARMKEPLGATVNVDPGGGTDDLDAWINSHVADAAKYGLPAPTPQSIYVLYVDPKTTFNYGGTDICKSGVGGYHTSTKIGGQEVAYAILPQCDHGSGVLDETTLSSSHEIGEATLDPHPQTNAPGWVGVDDAHLAWEFFMQFNSENGDLCEIYRDSFYRSTEASFPYEVQRQWSNASAKAGHNPCVPAPKTPYFNTVPLTSDKLSIDLTRFGAGTVDSKGLAIAVGDSKTFQIGFNSDAKVDAWTIKAIEGSAFNTGTPTHNLDIAIDKTTGTNGEKANVTVKVLKAGRNGFELMTIVSTLGTGGSATQHFMPLLISPP